MICENALECMLELKDCSFQDIEKQFEIFVKQVCVINRKLRNYSNKQ